MLRRPHGHRFAALTMFTMLAASLALPARTVEAATASTEPQLSTALNGGCTPGDTVTLTGDITDSGSDLAVSCDTTLDLAGYDLTLSEIELQPGVSFTITDSTAIKADAGALVTNGHPFGPGIKTTGASLTISGTVDVTARGGSGSAGIGGDIATGGALTVTGEASVTARGGVQAAGIGGGASGGTRPVVISGSATVTAIGGGQGAGIGGGGNGNQGQSVTISGSANVTATGGTQSAGIGGGALGNGGSVSISGTATVTVRGTTGGAGIGGGATGEGSSTVIAGDSTVTINSDRGLGGGNTSTVFGSVELADNAVLRLAGGTLDIPNSNTTAGTAGAEITVGPNASILGSDAATPTYGTVTGSGQIDNSGTITLPTGRVGVSVFDNHHRVEFDNGGSTDPDPGAQRVFAENFTDGNRVFPGDPTRTGATFAGWNTSADGSGSAIDADATLPGSSADGSFVAVPLFARYTFDDPNLVISGTPKVDEELAATIDPQSSNTTVAYQWQTVDGGGALDIAGANAATYTPSSSDRGKVLRAIVTLSATDATQRIESHDTSGVAMGDQTITFDPAAPTQATVGGTYVPTATGGASGNPVTFTIATTSTTVCSIHGGTVAFDSAGTCTIEANQVGNTNYNPAPQVTHDITVDKADQTITFDTAAPTQASFGDTYIPTATGGDSGNPVTFTIATATNTVCSINGDTVTFDSPGTCTIEANQAGNTNYNPAPQVTHDITVDKADQTITFDTSAPTETTVGGTYTPTATAGGSGNPVTFSVDPASDTVCSIDGGTVTFEAPGTCTIVANQASDDDHNAASPTTIDITVDTPPTTTVPTTTAPATTTPPPTAPPTTMAPLSPNLPATGSSPSTPMTAGALLALVGLAAVIGTRRRLT